MVYDDLMTGWDNADKLIFTEMLLQLSRLSTAVQAFDVYLHTYVVGGYVSHYVYGLCL